MKPIISDRYVIQIRHHRDYYRPYGDNLPYVEDKIGYITDKSDTINSPTARIMLYTLKSAKQIVAKYKEEYTYSFNQAINSRYRPDVLPDPNLTCEQQMPIFNILAVDVVLK